MEKKQKPLHAGHRQRLKDRFLKENSSLSDPELLELLLFYSIPQKDTVPIANDLLNRFGSLEMVFRASDEELTAVKGIKENSLILLRLFNAIRERMTESKASLPIMETLDDAGELLFPYFAHQHQESLLLLSLDEDKRVIACDMLEKGDENEVLVNVSHVTRTALRREAAYVVMAHSHPSGIAIPSQADLDAVKACKTALQKVHIELWDNLIFADDDYMSFALSRLL